MWRKGAQTHTIMVGEDADMEEGWTTNVEGTCRLEAHETEASGLAGLFSTSSVLSTPSSQPSVLPESRGTGKKARIPLPSPSEAQGHHVCSRCGVILGLLLETHMGRGLRGLHVAVNLQISTIRVCT